MGKIKKILENELVGGAQNTDVYPVTSTKAVYNENNEKLDDILFFPDEYDLTTHNNKIGFKNIYSNSERYIHVIANKVGWACNTIPLLPSGTYKFISFLRGNSKSSVTISGRTANNTEAFTFKINCSIEGLESTVTIPETEEEILELRIIEGVSDKTNGWEFFIERPSAETKYSKVKIFDTFIDLEKDNTLADGDLCQTLGYYTKYDGGGGLWKIENQSNSVPIESRPYKVSCMIAGKVFKYIKNGTLAMLLNNENTINVLQCGVKNNGEDCTQQLIDLFSFSYFNAPKESRNSVTFFFPAGRYTIKNSIPIKIDNITFRGENSSGINFPTNGFEPYWSSNEELVTGKDNGMPGTIIRFVPTDSGDGVIQHCFSFKSNGCLENITLVSKAYEIINTAGGTTPKWDEPMKEQILIPNVGGVYNCDRIVNCRFIGFSDAAIYSNGYSYIHDVYFENCNKCISNTKNKSLNDNQISNIRVVKCKTIATLTSLNLVNNVRCDSIHGPAFIIKGSGNQFNNIIVDYCVKSVFDIIGIQARDIIIHIICGRTGYNTWNNNVDNGGTINTDECLIHFNDNFVGGRFEVSFSDYSCLDSLRGNDYFYPCIFGIDASVKAVSAAINYNGKAIFNSNHKVTSVENNGVSTKRLFQFGNSGNFSGVVSTEDNILKLVNLDNNYSSNNILKAFG